MSDFHLTRRNLIAAGAASMLPGALTACGPAAPVMVSMLEEVVSSILVKVVEGVAVKLVTDAVDYVLSDDDKEQLRQDAQNQGLDPDVILSAAQVVSPPDLRDCMAGNVRMWCIDDYSGAPRNRLDLTVDNPTEDTISGALVFHVLDRDGGGQPVEFQLPGFALGPRATGYLNQIPVRHPQIVGARRIRMIDGPDQLMTNWSDMDVHVIPAKMYQA